MRRPDGMECVTAIAIIGAVIFAIILAVAMETHCDGECQNEKSCVTACESHGLEFECAYYSHGSFGPTITECWCWDPDENRTVELW